MRAKKRTANPKSATNFGYGARPWQNNAPVKGNAGVAGAQHIVHFPAPSGVAAFALAHGSMSSSVSGEREIRKSLIHDGLANYLVTTGPSHQRECGACL